MSEHPEQNTQRPSESESASDVPLKSPLPLIKDATRADIQPAPQTEAVDVDAVNRAIALARGVVGKWKYAGMGETEIKPSNEARLVQIICEQIYPLTQRIAELEKDLSSMTEARNEYAKGFATQSRLHSEIARECEAAEARVKELEAKLAGAIKVTTENTIAHMQAKP